MRKEIHEFLGFCALAALIATGVVGVASYRYQLFKRFLQLKRETLVSFHWWGGLAFVILVVLHYVTTDKTRLLLYIGAIALVAVFSLGLSLRFSRKAFQFVIKTKISLVVMGGIALLIGHSMLEGDEHRREGHGEQESRYEDVVPSRARTHAWRGVLRERKPGFPEWRPIIRSTNFDVETDARRSST